MLGKDFKRPAALFLRGCSPCLSANPLHVDMCSMHSASEDADIVCLHNGQNTLCEDMLGGRRGGGEGWAGWAVF